MIKYNFICKFHHNFDMWFKNIEFYEQQMQKSDEIICPICSTNQVKKQIVAPALVSSINSPKSNKKSQEIYQTDVDKISNLYKQVNDYVKSNFKYVGDKLKDTAINMQQGKQKIKGIYGEATKDDLQELKEANIDVIPLPISKNKKTN
ncbi:DUF1178 family protein [Rickettsiales bacterium LUAb2]